jgi:hypothetical protein
LLSPCDYRQNRAYAVSQLTDLHSKLNAAQRTISSTRVTLPTYNKNGTGGGSELSQALGPMSPGSKGKVGASFRHFKYLTDLMLRIGKRSGEEGREEGRRPAAQECQRRVSPSAFSSYSLFILKSEKIPSYTERRLLQKHNTDSLRKCSKTSSSPYGRDKPACPVEDLIPPLPSRRGWRAS